MSRDLVQAQILDNIPNPAHGLLQLAPRVGRLLNILYLCNMETKGTHIKKRDIYIKAVEYYNTNVISISECAIKFNIDRHNLSRWIRKNGGITNPHGKNKVNSTIFNIIDTEEKAYWLGFLYADGCVYDKNNISLELGLKDKTHLEKFNKFIGRDKQIKEDHFRVRCMFKDSQIYTDLNNLGVVPRKSLILTFPTKEKIPNNLVKHFIRGYIDGDGSIYLSNNNIFVSVLGTKEFLVSLIENIDLPKRTLYKNNKNNDSNCWFFQYSGKNAIKLIKYLYTDSTIYLERKYKKYLDFAVLRSNS